MSNTFSKLGVVGRILDPADLLGGKQSSDLQKANEANAQMLADRAKNEESTKITQVEDRRQMAGQAASAANATGFANDNNLLGRSIQPKRKAASNILLGG
jgi:hypothetical protein